MPKAVQIGVGVGGVHFKSEEENTLVFKMMALIGGVCTKHGALIKRCSSEGCTNQAKRRGLCVKHGAKVKRCSIEGCTKSSSEKRVSVRHGAKLAKKKYTKVLFLYPRVRVSCAACIAKTAQDRHLI